MNKQTLRMVIFTGLFLVPFVPFLVSSSLFFPFITTKVFAWRVIVEIIFAAWVLLALVDPEARPRKSPILYSIGAFLLLIGLADVFGMAPLKSFWSNFERMEGYISLLHLGAFFLVIGSVFREQNWRQWWNTSLAASFIMVIYSAFQLLGVVTINQGGVRVDGTFGNAIYLAVYMLFHIFFALFLMVRQWKEVSLRWVYGGLIFLQMAILYFTATRGAVLGLMGGLVVFAVLNVRNKEEKGLRRFGMGVMVTLVVLVGGFFVAKDTNFVRESPVLSRFATLSLEELKSQGRYFVWPMAWEGFKDRPILGWGQENFSYVFQEHYRPEMYALEPWFDRAHNIFLDWMVAGGALGLFSYLSLYGAALYLIWKGSFSTFERSVLIALMFAYFLHNFFVFDNLISYILFFSLLAYLHSRSNAEILWKSVLSEGKAKSLAIPLVALGLLTTLYFVNWKPIVANTSLISAFKAVQLGQYANVTPHLEKAFDAASLGRTEVVEQTAAQAAAIIGSDIPAEGKNVYYTFAVKVIGERGKELESDARYHMMSGSFFSSLGKVDEALIHLEKALSLMPRKQAIHFQIAEVYIYKKDYKKALEVAKTAYELDPTYINAQFTYAVVAIYAGDRKLENMLRNVVYAGDLEQENEIKKSGEIVDVERWVSSDLIVVAYMKVGRYDDAIEMLRGRIRKDPSTAQHYISLASVYLEKGDSLSAIQALRNLAQLFPEYKDQAETYIKQIQEGREI